MSVHELKDGRWICQWRERESGKLKRRYFGRSDDSEAQARSFNESLGLRHYPDDEEFEPVYFEKIAGAYLQSRQISVSPETFRVIYSIFMKRILPGIGTISLSRLSHEHLDQYVGQRLKAGVRKTTIHNELTYIMAALNFAVERKAIDRNPVQGYRKPTRDDRIIQPPTAAEVSAILAHAAPHLVRALAISYFTGLRPGKVELLTLRWDSVDMKAKTILITSAQKGGPRSRSVPIHPKLLLRLQAWKKDDGENATYIIHFQKKAIQSLKTAFRLAKKRAGITRPLRMYDFRHAFASNLLEAGADLKSVSEILGHSRPDTTLKTYQHTSLTLHRQTINLLPSISFPDSTTKGEKKE